MNGDVVPTNGRPSLYSPVLTIFRTAKNVRRGFPTLTVNATMNINNITFNDWEELLRDLRGNSKYVKAIEVSTLAPYGYGGPLGDAMFGHEKISSLSLELSNLFHPSDTLNELTSLFTVLATSVSLDRVAIACEQECEFVQFVEPMFCALCTNPNIVDLSVCHEIIKHGGPAHLLKNAKTLVSLHLDMKDNEDQICDGVLNALRFHSTLTWLDISFHKDCKAHCGSLQFVLHGLTTLRDLTLEYVVFNEKTMNGLLQGLSTYDDATISLSLVSCSFDKKAMEQFVAFMSTCDGIAASPPNPIGTLQFNEPRGMEEASFRESVAAMCTCKSPLHYLTVDFRDCPDKLSGFLGQLIKNSPTQLRALTVYGEVDKMATAKLSSLLQSEVHLKEIRVSQVPGVLEGQLVRSLRSNGSIWHAELNWSRNELAKFYGKRNQLLPSLLGKDASRKADLSLFPILCTVSRVAKSIAPNNIMIGLLAGRHSIGPIATNSESSGTRESNGAKRKHLD
jgi:hypothetical protein